MASKSLGTLTLDLIARTGGFVKGMSQAERSSQKWRKQVQRDLKKLRGQFATFAKAAAGAGVAAAGAFTILAKEGLQFVDSQAKMATRLGSTIDDLRALQIAAGDFGIEQGKLTSGLASYTKRLGDAARGTGEAQKAYEALGLEAKDLVNLPLPEQLALIAERIAQVDSAAERASIVDRLMSGGRGMVNLFEEGGGAIRAAVQEVDEFGLSINAVDAEAVEKANDQLGRIPRILEPIKSQIAINLAEPLSDAADLMIEASREAGGLGNVVIDVMENAAMAIAMVLDQIDTLRVSLMKVQRIQLQSAAAGANIRALVTGEENTPEQQALDEFNAEIDRIESGDTYLQRIANVLEDLGDGGLQENADRRERLQAGRDAGLGGAIDNDAIAASVAVADALKNVTDAANDSAEADEDKTEKSQDAAEAVKDLGNSSDRASRALDGIAGIDWGRGALGAMEGEQDNGGRSVRQRIEAGKDLSAYALEPNPSARPTWSSDYLTNPDSDLAERISSRAPWFGGDAGVAKVQSTAASVAGGSAGGGKNHGTVTIKVVGDNGSAEGEVQGEDAFLKQLANVLSGAAAGSR